MQLLTKNRIILLFGIFLILLTACTPPVADLPDTGDELPTETEPEETETPTASTEEATLAPGQGDGLLSTVWELVAFREGGTESPVIEGSRVSLEIDENGQAGGSGGCNSYGGQAKIEANNISFSEIHSTLMACLDDGVMEQETRFYQALENSREFELDGDRLTIFYGEGQDALVFVAADQQTGTSEPSQEEPAGLANTAWRLVSFGPAESPEPVIEGSKLTLEFDDAGRAGGNGGCNTFGASYEVMESTLTFGEITSTRRACVEESLTQQEVNYFRALQNAGQFELSGDSLIIYYDEGQGILNFVRENE